jgi:hypothetical protein
LPTAGNKRCNARGSQIASGATAAAHLFLMHLLRVMSLRQAMRGVAKALPQAIPSPEVSQT